MSGKTTQELTVNQQVEKINGLLCAFRREAVQEIKVGTMVRYGYKPQYVFDAVNTVFSQEKWRYEVISAGQNGSQITSARKSRDSTSHNEQNDNGLPRIAGISYQQREGMVIAHGNSFNKKELLKSAGFKWDQNGKNWYKEIAH